MGMTKVFELKERGNASLKAKNYAEAIEFYSLGIKLDESNHILYSNRSAAYCRVEKYMDALKDADKVVSLKPDWSKGYSRQGTALQYLKRYKEAKLAYEKGLKLDPANKQLMEGLEEAESKLSDADFKNPFEDPLLIEKLEQHPKTTEWMKEPDYRSLIEALKENPKDTAKLADPRILETLGALMGFEVAEDGDDDSGLSNGNASGQTKAAPKASQARKDPTAENARQALKEKEQGNAAYKAKNFDKALKHYGKAIELDPTDITFYTNKAAAYLEKHEYDECIKVCEKALEVGREYRADNKAIAKALARMGKAYNMQKNYHEALKYLNKSLSEHQDPEIKKQVTETKKMSEEQGGKDFFKQAMATKKFINSVDRCVDECLAGVVAVNPGLQILEGHRVIIRADIDQVKAAGKVTILCGGGSGHEPAHAGYIGPGMLSGAIAGAVFASPPPNSILAAIRAVGKGNPAGTLLLIKSYTGDRLNFGIAAERAKAEGISVEMVVVGEDTALTSHDKTAGRRGLCGTVLIEKIAGALAEEGKSLAEIVAVANQAVSNMGTIGISASPCSVPGSGPSFQLGHDEMELGLGIHGEAGVKRMKMLSAKKTLETMLDHLSSEASSTHLPINTGDHVALMVNNLGGTSVLELNIMAKEAIDYLENRHVKVDRVYCGTFMTSLEMAGASMTLLHLDDTLKRCLDAATSAPAWSKPLLQPGAKDRVTPKQMAAVSGASSDKGTDIGLKVDAGVGQKIYKCIKAMCDVLIRSENQLNKLDTEGGDGDCGTTHRRGAEAILKSLEASGLNVTCPYQLVLSLAHIVEQEMGGSSGALYSLFLSAAALPLMQDTSSKAWFAALEKGISAMARYGGAEPGDRTMMDSFNAAQTSLRDNMSKMGPLKALELAVQVTEVTAQSTAMMQARAGRASYVSAERLKQPDPGAIAVAIWLKAIYQALV